MISWCFALLLSPSDVSPADLEFFEARIRPVLIERCYRCHNSVDSAKGRLALDHSQAMLEGGRSGPAIVPGDPEASLLMRAVRHDDGVADLHVVPNGALDSRARGRVGGEVREDAAMYRGRHTFLLCQRAAVEASQSLLA